MKRILLMLVVVFMVGGCAIALKPDFSIRVKEDLGVTPIVYYRADWIHGVYGYPDFVEAFVSQNIQITRGALVAGDEKVAFVRFDKQIRKSSHLSPICDPRTRTKSTEAILNGGRDRNGYLLSPPPPFTRMLFLLEI